MIFRDFDWLLFLLLRCVCIENNKCVLWCLIKLCDWEMYIYILLIFWGFLLNFIIWYILLFWVDWDRIFLRIWKKFLGEIYVFGVKVFLYICVFGVLVKLIYIFVFWKDVLDMCMELVILYGKYEIYFLDKYD